MDTIKHNLDCTACSYSGGLGIGLGFGSRLDRGLVRGLDRGLGPGLIEVRGRSWSEVWSRLGGILAEVGWSGPPLSLPRGHVGGHVGWAHGVMLEVMVGSFWDHVGVMFESCWMPCWGHVGGHVGVMLDVMLGSCWEVVFFSF